MVAPAIGPKLHRLVPDADFRWLENSSHFAHVDSPDRVAATAREFLASA
jgi:pimeloyl-ACP methyl ester carboxylesterase